jgi:hypothetical protein
LRRLLIVAAVLAVVSTACPGDARERREAAPAVAIGAHVSGGLTAYQNRESQVGKMSAVRIYHRYPHLTSATVDSELRSHAKAGRVIVLSTNLAQWPSTLNAQEACDRFITGELDAAVREYARDLRDLKAATGATIYHAWQHEPEFGGQLTASCFKSGWNRVFSLFAEQGYDPNNTFITGRFENDAWLSKFYPGNATVEAVGTDDYTWPPQYPGGQCTADKNAYLSFRTVTSGTRANLAQWAPGRPWVLAETGAREWRTMGPCVVTADRSLRQGWIRAMIPAIEEYAANMLNPLKAVLWFDSGGHALDTTEARTAWSDVIDHFSAPARLTSCPQGEFLARYHNSRDLTGTPVLMRCEEYPLANFWPGSPATAVNADNFSVQWAGTFTFPGGDTTFSAKTDDGMRVWIDGKPVIDVWKPQPPTNYSATRPVSAGVHSVRVEHFEASGGAAAHLSWGPAKDVAALEADNARLRSRLRP